MAQEVARTRRGRQKKLRPDGTEYSSDPKERHAQLVEDGKIGGKGSELARIQGAKGGRPRKPRPAELIAEKARENAERMWKVYDDALHEDQPIKVRMAAAKDLNDIVKDEARLQLDEDKFDDRSKDELVAEMNELLHDPIIRAALSGPGEQVAPGEGFDHNESAWSGESGDDE